MFPNVFYLICIIVPILNIEEIYGAMVFFSFFWKIYFNLIFYIRFDKKESITLIILNYNYIFFRTIIKF